MAKQEMFRTCPGCGQLLPINIVRCDCGYCFPLQKGPVVITTVVSGVISYILYYIAYVILDSLFSLLSGFPILGHIASFWSGPITAAFIWLSFVNYFCSVFYSSQPAVSLYAKQWIGILGIVIHALLYVWNFTGGYIPAARLNGLLAFGCVILLIIARAQISEMKKTGKV